MIRFERVSWWSIGLLLLAGSPAVAQEPAGGQAEAAPVDTVEVRPGPATLLSGMPALGFYAGPFSRFGRIRNQLAVYPGMRLGVVLGSTLGIGLSGGLLANHIALDTIPGNDLKLKYAGFEIETIVGARKLVHASIRMLAGPGLLSDGSAPAAPAADAGAPAGETASADTGSGTEMILILEPALEVTLNLSRMLRLSVGANYRTVRGIDGTFVTSQDLSGWLGSFAIKIAAY